MAVDRKVVVPVMVLAALVVVGAIGERKFQDATTDPTMPDVVRIAQKEIEFPAAQVQQRTVDGIGFPDWSRWGWKAIGGRSDVLADEREAATMRYRRGRQTITFTVVAGTGHVEDAQPVRGVYRNPPLGKTELTLGGVGSGFKPSLRDPATRATWAGWPAGLYDCESSSDCDPGPGPGALTVKRKIKGRTIVLTGWTPSDPLLDEMQDLALRTKT